MKMSKYSELMKLKIILIGESYVGKSSLMRRYETREYRDHSLRPTIGLNSCVKEVDGCRLSIYDTAGEEKYKSVTPNYYRKAHGVILVFDVTDRMSFNEIPVWRANVIKGTKNKPIFLLVGNKCEDEGSRVVGRREAQDMADTYSMEYIETSAKDGTNVDKAFETIIRMICEAVQVPVDEKTRCNEQVIVNLQASISYSNNKKHPCKC